MDNTPNKEDTDIGTLIDQLQNASNVGRKAVVEPDPLKKEEMERFVIEKGGELVKESLEFMKSMRDYVSAAPRGEDIGAVGGLIAATSSALETLNKLIVVDKKIDASVKIKEMDIKSRKELANEENNNRLMLTREEVFKRLMSNAIPVSAEVVSITPVN